MSVTLKAESSADVWQMPRVDRDERLVSGTAAGIAREIGIDAIYTRVAFVVLALAGGWGIVAYVGLGLAMHRSSQRDKGVTPYEPVPKGATPSQRVVGFVMITFGLVVVSSRIGLPFPAGLVWPTALVGVAIAVTWDRGDGRWPLDTIAEVENGRSRLVLGLVCLFAGVIVALTLSLSLAQAVSGIIVSALVLLGAGIVFAPFVQRLGTELLSERRERIRVEERTEMAAHLHDSVLQTLTLIQKRADDPSVVSLARRQERELRSWLFGDQALRPALGFRAELERRMGLVEQTHEVPVEVVVVGDTPVVGDVEALLRASTEATTNAARHSGAPRVDVFAEVLPDAIEIFVRDQGSGFDPSVISADRAGLRESVLARMDRHGGHALITSSPGEGTEIELRLPLRATAKENTP